MPGRQKQKHLRWTPPGPYSPSAFDIPAHDPPLSPRDEAVFLLHTGAEVEHALLVQYLYAAYSVKAARDVPEGHAAKVKSWKRTLLGIAREEMGHLITVQNLLRLIGGPINLEREDYPFRSHLYPFRFRLEPLSRASLAKYVVAEMPYMPDPPDEIREIITRAASASTMQVNQVGAIYARLMQLFTPSNPNNSNADAEPGLSDDDFVLEAATHQARYDTWGGAASVLVPEVSNRALALHAIEELAEQGEGLDEPADPDDSPSHYERFLAMYREFPEPGDWEPAYQVPVDPGVGTYEGVDAEEESGRITHPLSLQWANLFNLRYRLLLAYLSHFLQSDGPLLDDKADYTPRGLLNKWTFDEMRYMSRIASRLVTLPRAAHEPGEPELAGRAGAPFDLPYTLNLPNREGDRWRSHGDVLSTCLRMARSIAATHSDDANEPLLAELVHSDTHRQELVRALARGEALPPPPQDFKKVVQLLEDGVRGFRIGAHHNFWRDCTRDQFVATSVFGNPLIATTPDGTFDAAGSNLIKALRGEPPFNAPESDGPDHTLYPRMPVERPPLPKQAVEYIAGWIERGCPDSEPPGQVGLSSTP
jgi:hypothetical protein